MYLSIYAENKNETHMILYESGHYHDKNRNENVGTYAGAVIPDKETEMETVKAIFNGMYKSKDAQEYVSKSIFYDTQDELWMISFGKD